MKYSALLKCTALLGIINLAGCGTLFGEDGFFRDRGDDYLKAESIPPMDVPGDVDQEALGELYVIPDVHKADYEYPEEFVAPRPEALSSNVYSDNVKIQKLDDERWIFINASPSEVWPRVRNFLNNNGLQVASTDAPRGLIETAWLNFKDDPDSRDKYRLRIEQGVQPDSAEVHVTHLSMPRDAEMPAQVVWPEHSSSEEREGWMIQELAASLAAEIGSASASLLAQTIGGSPKVAIVARDGEPVLRMELEPLRAMATLNHALQQEGLRIVDQDSGAGIYYVQYQDPDEGEGFFSGWFSRDEAADKYRLEDVLAQMKLADTPANRKLFPAAAFQSGGDELKDASGYLFVAKPSGDAVEVVVRNLQGQALEPRDAREMLGLVRRNLI